MSSKRFILLLLSPIFMLSAANSLQAQNWPSDDPPFVDNDEFYQFTPFVEPGNFDHDLQFFAPAEIGEFGGYPEPPIGWYFDYARVYWGATRPDRGARDDGNTDFAWGNRFDFGYMTEHDNGWAFEFLHFDGPTNVGVSVGEMYGAEMLKTFRLEPFHDGGVAEVFIGGRFSYINDSTLGEEFALNESQNNIFQGVTGLRYWKRKGRWTLSAELRLMAGQNVQDFDFASADEFVFAYDARATAAFQVTRDVALQVGLENLNFLNGISRLGSAIDNDEPLSFAGVNIGIVVNR